MKEYLQISPVIDWQHPEIIKCAHQIALGHQTPEAIAKACFEWVRDEICHSFDYQMNPVTWRASDVLKHKTGYCYAKSHLLAALLRANQIPSGFCYQRLSIDDQGAPYSLHGFNAIYLPEFGWYRVDARGNKAGVNAQFTPPHEQLAFQTQFPEEANFPAILAEPLPLVVESLQAQTTWDDMLRHLPDIAPDAAQNYGLLLMTLNYRAFPTQLPNPDAQGAIVALHGWGANCDDLISLAPLVGLPNYQWICPEAPFNHPMPNGKMWYDLQSLDAEGLAKSCELLSQFLEDLPTLTGIPLEKTFLLGFSQGGAMTLDVGLGFPLAGLISLSGYLHIAEEELQEVANATFPPIFIAHGTEDTVVPIGAARNARQLFEALGATVEYEEYEMSHEIRPETCDRIRKFILEHQVI